MLYWAEGAKRRNTIQFTNSDPHMLVFFRKFLVEAMAIEPDEIVMSINVYTNNGMAIDEIERYWLDLLELPARSVRKHMLNHLPTSSSGRARNKLPYGVVTLNVHSTCAPAHLRSHSGVRRLRRAGVAGLTCWVAAWRCHHLIGPP